MPCSHIIICEKRPRWSIAFRRECPAGELHVVESRSLAHGWQALEEDASGVLAVEVTQDNLNAVLQRLVALGTRFRHARGLALTDFRLRRFEPLLRTAGAHLVLYHPHEVAIATSWLRKHSAQAPRVPSSFADSVRARLPWATTRP